MPSADDPIEALKREWTDRHVVVHPERPELRRFAGVVGRVVTVNCNGKAVIDFQDGGWYDVPATVDHLVRADVAAASRYDAKANSAQAFPARKA